MQTKPTVNTIYQITTTIRRGKNGGHIFSYSANLCSTNTSHGRHVWCPTMTHVTVFNQFIFISVHTYVSMLCPVSVSMFHRGIYSHVPTTVAPTLLMEVCLVSSTETTPTHVTMLNFLSVSMLCLVSVSRSVLHRWQHDKTLTRHLWSNYTDRHLAQHIYTTFLITTR
jgi:hypothetical protein